MHLTATISRDEIAGLLADATPLHLELGRKRSVTFGRPQRVELLAGLGLRIRSDARLLWDVAGITLPVTVRAWQILLVPKVTVRNGAHLVLFDPRLELLEFRRLPALFDERIVGAINEAVASQRRKLAWNVTRAVGARLPVPPRVIPASSFELVATSADIAVTAQDLRIEVTFSGRVLRTASPDGPAAPESSAPESSAPASAWRVPPSRATP